MEITENQSNRTMKKFIIQIATSGCFVLVALSITLVVSTVSCKTGTTPEKLAGATNTSQATGANQPAVQADTGKSEGRFYTCAMHPTVRSLDPDGKCPFCGMALLPAETVDVVDPASGKTNTAATFPAVSGYYSCPMHPTVLSTNADDKCPSCGMPLLPVENPVFIQNK
jgi:hypothetical protein